MPVPATKIRAKISTTIAAENFAFLQTRVASGHASSVADAVDQSISALRQLVNRARLAEATRAYFEDLDATSADEERELERNAAHATGAVDFDREL